MKPFERKRLAAGLTITELAAKLNLHPSTVSKWESGDARPEPQYFPKLAGIFGITGEEVTYLFAPADATAAA